MSKKVPACLSVSKAARYLGVHPQTLRNWERRGRIKVEHINTRGDRRFKVSELDRILGRSKDSERREALYVRMSGSKGQETSLVAQEEQLRATSSGEVVRVFSDCASGLNEKRPGLRRLLQGAERREFTVVRVTHTDRLTRFGFDFLRRALSAHGVEVEVLHDSQDASPEQELVDDFMALVSSFAGRIYGQRSARARRRLLESVR